jgi:hypothetical protein
MITAFENEWTTFRYSRIWCPCRCDTFIGKIQPMFVCYKSRVQSIRTTFGTETFSELNEKCLQPEIREIKDETLCFCNKCKDVALCVITKIANTSALVT